MTITYFTYHGGIQGRCTTRCQTSHATRCTCICAGRFHGSSTRATLPTLLRAIRSTLPEHTAQRDLNRGCQISFVPP